jgi:hypothetical protein
MKCKIYKIISENTPMVYIGSTTKHLQTRLKNHIRDYNYRIDYYNWFYDYSHNFENIPDKFKKEPGNVTSYKILRYGEFNIELLEEFDYEIKSDILKREQFYINLYEGICVNSNNAWSGFTYTYKHGESEKNLKVDALENLFCKNCNNNGHDTSWINCCNNLNSYNHNNYKKLLEDIRRFKYAKV